MERPEFDITITKAGKVKVHVKGVQGRCIQLADLLKEILGKEDERQLTADYYALDGKVRINAEVRGVRPG